MNKELVIIGAVLLPLIGFFTLPLASHISQRLRNWLAFVLVGASFAICTTLIPTAMAYRTLVVEKHLVFGFNMVFIADGLAVFMACLVSFIGAIVVLYSMDYIRRYENQNEYYFMIVLFLGAMMGLVFSGNLIQLYIFWELTAITT